MTGSKGRGQDSSVKEDGEVDVDDGGGSTTKEQTTAEEDSCRRPASSRGAMMTGQGAESNAASAPKQSETAAVVPPAGGFGFGENKGGEQETLREQLEALVSQKLRVNGGELDHAGLVALEALSKLPAARDLASSCAGPGAGASAGDGRPKQILPLGLEKIKKFSGKNCEELTDIFNQFYSLVVAALPFQSPGAINKALTRDVVFILEGSALKFFNSLKTGEVEWESLPPPANMADDPAAAAAAAAAAPLPCPDDEPGATAVEGKQQQPHQGLGGRRFRPPSTWVELSEAFHDHFLPATGIARTSEKLLSSSQAPGESVLSLAQRQLGLATHLNRLIEANGGQIDFMEAISMRLFERGLRADLRRMHDTEPPCLSFQQSVDRAERNAIKLAKMRGISGKSEGITGLHTLARQSSGVASESSDGAGDSGGGGAGGGAGGGGGGGSVLPRVPGHDSRERRSRGVSPPRATASNALPERRKYATGGDAVDTFSGGGPSMSLKQAGGDGEDGRALGKRKKMKRGQKRMRDGQENRHVVEDRCPGLPPNDPVDPDAMPPCRNPGCRSINRNFHSTNDCWFGKNGKNGRPPPGFRHRGPPSYYNNGSNN